MLEADDRPRLVGAYPLDQQFRTARALIPALQQLLDSAQWKPTDVQLVSVAAGPGSFTGLRIAVTAAKTFAYAVGAKLTGVSTLAVIATQAAADQRPIWAVLSAQRGELFCARFASLAEATFRCGPTDANARILSVEAWLDELAPGDVVAGPPLQRLADRIPDGVEVADAAAWQPLAETVGRLGFAQLASGATVDPMQLTPYYLRRIAAEEQADRDRSQ